MADFSRVLKIDGRPREPAPLRDKLTPVVRETVQDRVYQQLRQALIYGLFDPGEVLIIQDLAVSMQTSTMPVRDALSRLISEQALEALPNRSVRVPVIDPKRLDDLLKARIVIEGAALELATHRITDEEIEALHPLIGHYDEALANRSDYPIEEELDLNKSFHFRIYQHSGSDVLFPIIESLWLQSGPYVRAAVLKFDPKSEISALHYHREILAALKARDAEAAKRALASDISRAFDLLRDTPLTDSEPAPPTKRRYRRKT
ncbi:GntR family transcriptional regulator [Rhizobium sp. LjRoot30]|uniref:GntR family transcriptional regulator n=1 Tax=Rhizobium sp. LjRoot30 TaxID=3342320 RepID=UPI003ECDA535